MNKNLNRLALVGLTSVAMITTQAPSSSATDSAALGVESTVESLLSAQLQAATGCVFHSSLRDSVQPNFAGTIAGGSVTEAASMSLYATGPTAYCSGVPTKRLLNRITISDQHVTGQKSTVNSAYNGVSASQDVPYVTLDVNPAAEAGVVRLPGVVGEVTFTYEAFASVSSTVAIACVSHSWIVNGVLPQELAPVAC